MLWLVCISQLHLRTLFNWCTAEFFFFAFSFSLKEGLFFTLLRLANWQIVSFVLPGSHNIDEETGFDCTASIVSRSFNSNRSTSILCFPSRFLRCSRLIFEEEDGGDKFIFSQIFLRGFFFVYMFLQQGVWM